MDFPTFTRHFPTLKNTVLYADVLMERQTPLAESAPGYTWAEQYLHASETGHSLLRKLITC